MSALILNESITPVLRGGRANFALPVFVFATIVLWNVMKLEGPAPYVLGAFILFWMIVGLHAYIVTLVRLTFGNDHIEVIFPLHIVRLRYDAIHSLRFVRYSITPVLRLQVRGSRSVRIVIVGPYTPWGSLDECSRRLREEFAARGVSTNEV